MSSPLEVAHQQAYSGGCIREELREPILTAAASIYPIDTEYLGTRVCPSGRGMAPTRRSCVPAGAAAGGGWRSCRNLGEADDSGPHVLCCSVFRDVQCEQETGKCQFLSLILHHDFTQTHTEVNPLNLDKRLNRDQYFCLISTNEGVVTCPAAQRGS